MRKVAVVGVTLVALTAGAVAAATVNCQADERCTGTADSDTLNGSEGPDSMYSLGGHDLLYGDDGDDRMHGGAGNDDLYGHAGGDSLYGGRDGDTLEGSAGRDALYGGRRPDRLEGEAGDDLLNGGLGGDRYLFTDGWGADLIDGDRWHSANEIYLGRVTPDLEIRLLGRGESGGGPDPSDGRPEVTAAGTSWTIDWVGHLINKVFAGRGDDTIHGSGADNVISLRYKAGNEGGGSDTVYAGAGDDVINAKDAGMGADTIHCGTGVDKVSYDEGEDTVSDDCEEPVP